MIPSSMKQTNTTNNTVIFNRVLHTESIELLKQKLYETNWDGIEASQSYGGEHKRFLNKFSDLYNTYFPKKINQIRKERFANSSKIFQAETTSL